MKKLALMLALLSLLLFGCAKKEISIVKTYEITESSMVESAFDNGEIVNTAKYYEMSDGTYKTESGEIYKYRLVITGRMHAAVRDSTFVFLSNIEDIPFDRAWKAAGFSSNLDDYFSPDQALLVGLG
ncbi:MAG: immunogenic protein [Ruminococcaceae bacterium]|nr:immunogenic protein [Oscillospiraceae bacterium]